MYGGVSWLRDIKLQVASYIEVTILWMWEVAMKVPFTDLSASEVVSLNVFHFLNSYPRYASMHNVIPLGAKQKTLVVLCR